jgi:hypothetical protein
MTASSQRSIRHVAPLRASDDGHHLVEADGTPFFWLADTAWEIAHRLDRDDVIRYLDDRAAKGYTVIQVVAHGRILDGWATAPNRYGHAPFVDGDPLRPDPEFFVHLGWIIDRALERGIRTALVPVWSGTAVVHEGALTTRNAKQYGRWIGDRFRDRGVVWVLGGDIGPVWYGPGMVADHEGHPRRELVDFRPVYDALAAGILAGAGDDALLTYHPTAGAPVGAPPARTSPYFGDRPWFGLNLIQSSHIDPAPAVIDDQGGFVSGRIDVEDDPATPLLAWSGPRNYLPIAAEYGSAPVRPVIDSEPCYEDHPRYRDTPYDGAIWRAEDARNAAYHALFAGAAGHTYGHVSVWDFYGAGGVREECTFFPEGFPRVVWTAGLSAPGAGQMQHARRLIESRPLLTRVPDDALVVSDRGSGSEHVNATRQVDGSSVFVYLPRGGQVVVDLARMSGPCPAWWFDPRTGAALAIGEQEGEGQRTFRAPAAGPGQDWVLVLDDASPGYPPPGIPPAPRR